MPPLIFFQADIVQNCRKLRKISSFQLFSAVFCKLSVYRGMQWTSLIKVDELASISGQLNRNLSQTITQKGQKGPIMAENKILNIFFFKLSIFETESTEHNIKKSIFLMCRSNILSYIPPPSGIFT